MGKTNFNFLREGLVEYNSRSSKLIELEWIEIPDPKNANRMPVAERKLAEENSFSKYLKYSDGFYLLDEKGKMLTSKEFARLIEEKIMNAQKNLVFLIGGAYGFSDGLTEMAKAKISLSPLTFSHQLVRLIFSEQIYRALSIIKGLPYHNE